MTSDSSNPTPRGPRFAAGLPAALLTGGREHDCRAHNLSRTGVLLVGAFPPPTGEQVAFALRSPGGDIDHRFTGRVARLEQGDDPGELRVAVEFVAVDAEQKRIIELLVARVVEGLAPASLAALRPGSPPQEIRKALGLVSVPHRIALAARAGPREREFLRYDYHPAVLESLARNPNITLVEIRALLEVTQLQPSMLQSVAADPRWSKDEDVRILVATHPQVPFPLAERIISELPLPVLKKVLTRPSLNAVLRDKIVKRHARG